MSQEKLVSHIEKALAEQNSGLEALDQNIAELREKLSPILLPTDSCQKDEAHAYSIVPLARRIEEHNDIIGRLNQNIRSIIDMVAL